MPLFGSKSSSWNELKVPGVELFLGTENAFPYRSSGAARVDCSRGTCAVGYLRGKEAFDAARARIEVPSKTGGAGVVAALSRVRLYGRFDDVREPGPRRSASSTIRRRETRCSAPRAVTRVAGFRCWPPKR
ncbi:MAG TPA: hypothetical protein VF469_40475 [Kofleriaceae bacterium]